jgi:hypothetical protein
MIHCSVEQQQRVDDVPIITSPSPNLCDEDWDRWVSTLVPEEKERLNIEGLVVGGSKEAPFLISPQIVPDCTMRVAIGGFLYRVAEDLTVDDDAEYAKEHSAEITRVLAALRNSSILSSDKDILLTFPAFDDKDVRPLIAAELKNGEYNAA